MVTLRAVFVALADASRREILAALARGPLSAGEIAIRFPVTRPAISRHLRVLRQAGLVAERRRGRSRIYRLLPGSLAAAEAWLDDLRSTAGAAPAVAGPGPGREPRAAVRLPRPEWRSW